MVPGQHRFCLLSPASASPLPRLTFCSFRNGACSRTTSYCHGSLELGPILALRALPSPPHLRSVFRCPCPTTQWVCHAMSVSESPLTMDPSTKLQRQPVLPPTGEQTSQRGSACPHDPPSLHRVMSLILAVLGPRTTPSVLERLMSIKINMKKKAGRWSCDSRA